VIPLEEVQAFVRSTIEALPPVPVALADAVGCVLSEPVIAREPSPSFANSSMDGYALRAEDAAEGGVQLKVIGSILAGDAPTLRVGPGEAVRIMTGAPIPAGADCVCMVEHTEADDDGRSVRIGRAIAVGEFIRREGDDVVPGQVLVEAGQPLVPAHVGVLAGQGLTSVRVHRRPRVGVLSTGDELVDGAGALVTGKIRNMNGPMLLALLATSGFEAVDLGVVGDDLDGVREGLARGIASCDAVISTGGVSVGDVDFVKTAIADLCGPRARSMQVAMRPGKPFTFATTPDRGIALFGLAGNPVSTLVGFEVFVRPALRLLGGHRSLDRPTVAMVLDEPLTRSIDGKVHMVHAKSRWGTDGRLHVTKVLREGSHLLNSVADADVLLVVPDGTGLASGDDALGILLRDDLATAVRGEI